MFGLGKIFSGGLLGKLLDSVGLGWMNNVLSLAANIMTGNWLAAAKDVFDLVSQFSNNSWMDRVSRSQPLGSFDTNGCFGWEGMSESRADELNTLVRDDDPDGTRSFTRAIYMAYETAHNNAVANNNLRYAYSSEPV